MEGVTASIRRSSPRSALSLETPWPIASKLCPPEGVVLSIPHAPPCLVQWRESGCDREQPVGKEGVMAADPRKRQKKLERRAAKRKEKKHLVVREQGAGMGERLTAATKYPVLHSWVTENFWTQG